MAKLYMRAMAALALIFIASPCLAQSLLPQCRNAGGSYIPWNPAS